MLSDIRFRILLIAIFAAIDLFFLIGQIEDLWKLLLDGGDASWVVAADNILDLSGKYKRALFDDLAGLDYIDGDVVIDKGKDVQVQCVDVTFYLEDIFFAHGLTLGILDDGHCGVQLIKTKVSVYLHAFSCLDVVKNKAFFNFSNI